MKNELIFNTTKIKKGTFKQNKNRKEWTKQEDNLILMLSKTLPRKDKWITIAKKINTKSPLECYRRLKSIDPKFKKGRWTAEEDLLLLKLVNGFGRSWNMISKIFKNRSNKQVKIRYDEYIDPKISADIFTAEEDALILKLYPEYLNKWSKYQAHLPNRSQKRIKLRFGFLNPKNCFFAVRSSSDNCSSSATSGVNSLENDKAEENCDLSDKFFAF